VTSSVSGKRSPAELIALHRRLASSKTAVLRGGNGIRTRVHGFAGRCLASRPSHRGGNPGDGLDLFRADDGIRTRDPHLGKVMRYQLRYVRLPHVPGGLRGPATVSEPRVESQTGSASNTFNGHQGHVTACAEPRGCPTPRWARSPSAAAWRQVTGWRRRCGPVPCSRPPRPEQCGNQTSKS
jgi:hypothetical protein